MMRSSLPTTNEPYEPYSLHALVVELVHADTPQVHSIAPLVEWVWLLFSRCLQAEQPELGERLLVRFWDDLEAAGPLDRLEQTLKRLMPRLKLTPAQKLHYGEMNG